MYTRAPLRPSRFRFRRINYFASLPGLEPGHDATDSIRIRQNRTGGPVEQRTRNNVLENVFYYNTPLPLLSTHIVSKFHNLFTRESESYYVTPSGGPPWVCARPNILQRARGPPTLFARQTTPKLCKSTNIYTPRVRVYVRIHYNNIIRCIPTIRL